MAADKLLQTSTAAPPSQQQQRRPKITLPPRPSFDSLLFGGAAAAAVSPGPMSLVSSFFGEESSYGGGGSFSQLLAGAMGGSRGEGEVSWGARQLSGGGGYKESRPSSPLFTIPPGFSPSGLLNSPVLFSPQSPFGISHQQALAQVTAQAAVSQSHVHLQAEYPPSSGMPPSTQFTYHTSFPPTSNMIAQEQVLPMLSDPRGPAELSVVSQPNKKSQPPAVVIAKPADDGYNWRKYGQKPIKGSEFPRSYYKCTHLNCPVKKKVERSLNGQITEIIYKGQHSHEMPQPNRRSKDVGDPNLQGKLEPSLYSQAGNMSIDSGPSRDQESTQLMGSTDSEEVDDAETRVEEDTDEPYPKRRNTEAGPSEVVSSHKTVTEPRIIVQTRSEVDLLDDGYRWRKYGQKVVKGNPHPRSYYKCTYVGCNVRKQVERAPTDSKAVITTYEGKHNHDVPAARSSSHNTANSNAPHKVAAEKHPLLGSNGQRPVVLQLKEEKIAVRVTSQ